MRGGHGDLAVDVEGEGQAGDLGFEVEGDGTDGRSGNLWQ